MKVLFVVIVTAVTLSLTACATTLPRAKEPIRIPVSIPSATVTVPTPIFDDVTKIKKILLREWGGNWRGWGVSASLKINEIDGGKVKAFYITDLKSPGPISGKFIWAPGTKPKLEFLGVGGDLEFVLENETTIDGVYHQRTGGVVTITMTPK